MTNFTRDQFKGTSTKTLKKIKEDEDKFLETRNNTDEIEITDGLNKIRIAPKFPNEEEFYLLEKRTWIPYEKDDGEETRIPVLDSKVHGGTKMDIIDEYVKFIKSKLDPNDKSDALKLAIIADWKKGLVAQHIWKAYAWKLKKDVKPEFGIFIFKRTVRDELCSLSIIEDEDEAIEVDPFTDVDSGTPILLTYNPKAKKANQYYSVKMSKNEYPLTDEMLAELMGKKPLSLLLRNNYTMDDFEKALDGLRIFDLTHEIDLISDDEFEDVITKVKSQYTSVDKGKDKKKKKVDEDDDDEEEDEKPKKKVSKKVVEEEDGDDEEEEAPKKKISKKVEEKPKKKVVEEEDEEDEEDEEEEKPKKPLKKKIVEAEDEDESEEDDDDEEEKPKKEEKKGKLSIDELRAKLAKKQGK